MALKFDPVDVIGAGCWETLLRFFLFVSAVMVGCGIGSWSLHAGHMFDEPWSPILYFLVGPLHLFSYTIFISFPLGVAGLFVLFRSEEPLAPRWAALASSLGFLVVLGYFKDIEHHWLTWPLWFLMTSMLCTATWFWMKWSRNRWAQELLDIKVENQERRNELHEKFGTVSTNMYDLDET